MCWPFTDLTLDELPQSRRSRHRHRHPWDRRVSQVTCVSSSPIFTLPPQPPISSHLLCTYLSLELHTTLPQSLTLKHPLLHFKSFTNSLSTFFPIDFLSQDAASIHRHGHLLGPSIWTAPRWRPSAALRQQTPSDHHSFILSQCLWPPVLAPTGLPPY